MHKPNHDQVALHYDRIISSPTPHTVRGIHRLLVYKPDSVVRKVDVVCKEALIAIINSFWSGGYNFFLSPLAINHTIGSTLHIDIDDPDFDLNRLRPTPSMIVFTGRGHHAYWFLNRNIPYHNLMLKSKHLADLYGTDRTFDLARVLRLAGTVNQKNGALVSILSANTFTYSPSTFEEAEDTPDVGGRVIPFSVQLAGIDHNTLGQIASRMVFLPDWLRHTIMFGHAVGADRSRVDYKVAMNLAEYGFTALQIAYIFSSGEYKISEKCLEGGDRYLEMLMKKVVARYPKCHLEPLPCV